MKKTKSEFKTLGLFDHINHIRQVKSPDYYSKLSDAERKSFNHYMILRCLSMDKSIIEEIAFLSKYFNVMDSESFYKVCVAVTPMNRNYFPYIKSKSKKFNDKLIEYVCRRYDVGSNDAVDYCKILMSTKEGKEELIWLCRGYGLKEKEAEKLLKVED